ncbi:MAG: (d)CMP kinase [Alphaproteobacteria bacterium]|nr:(d)CMP kinase [Alphaproteobacteria bacterium]
MIIAIDGPAGAGKGTIAGYLALKFNFQYLDTGMLYRALAKAVIQANVDPALAPEEVIQIAQSITIEAAQDPDLRGEKVAAMASQVAVIPEARLLLNDLQRKFSHSIAAPYQGAILDGRDIGTVICPEAECKLFITARPEVRTQRRLLETQESSDLLATMSQQIAERDKRDSTRQIAPLTPAVDAIIIDTSDLTIDEACSKAAMYVTKCLSELKKSQKQSINH